jgi:ribonuclease E
VGSENNGVPSIAPQHFGEGESASPVASDVNGAAPVDAPFEPRRDGAQLQGPQAQGAPGEGGRRKRRRRRRGRGQRDGQAFGVNDAPHLEGDHADTSANENDAFEDSASHSDNTHEDIGANLDAPSVTPNAPSAPEWSLAAQPAPERHAAPAVEKIEVAATSHRVASVEETPAVVPAPVAAVQTAAANAPEQPTRKGWWQRPFRLRD